MSALPHAILHRLTCDAEQINKEKQGSLFIVATPLGHLSDITIRALSVLQNVDLILAEDTRVAHILLKTYGLTTPTQAYHEYNAAALRPALLKRLNDGEKIALISDAGTPLISDPGFKLVSDVIAEGTIALYGIPGPSSILAALMVGGLPTDHFFFAGFLPHTSQGRKKHLSRFAAIPGTLVLFESPKRLLPLLKDALDILGDRTIAVCRELTKRYETLYRTSLSEMIAFLRSQTAPLKGEIVLLISPPLASSTSISDDELTKILKKTLQSQSLKDAVTSVSLSTGLSKRTVYTRALSMQDDGEADDNETFI
jgi:16S rRNA (cytidine1402-2'-O)-methyltransferase